jgi:hypothetical protein
MAATVVYARSRPRIAYVEEWRVLDFWRLSQFRNSFLLSLASRGMTPSDRREPGLRISAFARGSLKRSTKRSSGFLSIGKIVVF